MPSSLTRARLSAAAAACFAAGVLASAGVAAADLPAHPREIDFQPLEFDPPVAADYRFELSSGVPVYVATSGEFPLVTITLTFKGGAYMEPAGKEGLAGMTGQMIRRGGTASISADELDERFDFLAAQVNAFVGGTTAGASINTLKSNMDEALDLFFDMARNPGFQEDKVEILRDEILEAMKQRNDDAADIIAREWDRLMFGEDHFEGRVTTAGSITGITTDDMRRFHERIFHPGNLIIGVVGDVTPREIIPVLEQKLAGWSKGDPAPDVPSPRHEVEPGVYAINKDIPQGKVRIGYRGVERDHPDALAIDVMNDILGGGGFTSRITNRVRSDEGLAYSAGSTFADRVWYPGVFSAFYDSKSSTVPFAARIIFEEIDRIRTEPVSDEELETAKNSLIETFPRNFESKLNTVGLFINDEWTDRPDDWWATYRDRVRAITKDDVTRVAREHLDPSAMMILVVGDWADIRAGNADVETDASRVTTMDDFFDGRHTVLPLRDPLTQEPLEPAAADGNAGG